MWYEKITICIIFFVLAPTLQCFDAVGWVTVGYAASEKKKLLGITGTGFFTSWLVGVYRCF